MHKKIGFYSILVLALSGCSLFLGNVKSVEEKSHNYQVSDLSLLDKDWTRLESDTANDPARTDVQDVAFQSKKSSSIISLNSVCRASWDKNVAGLTEFTRSLLLGISDRSEFDEKEIEVDLQKALQTTLTGKLANQTVRLRTIVLRKGSCLYDLMYIARPSVFSTQEDAFNGFIKSIKLAQ